MTNEPRAMREIHDIRIQIYEEIKDMTSEERVALVRREAQELIDMYGLNIKRPNSSSKVKSSNTPTEL